MRKLILAVILLTACATASAQNIQLHYDFGRSLYNELDKTDNSYGRPALTTTVCGGCKRVRWSQAARVYILDRPQTSCVTLDKYLSSLCLTSFTDKM